jgi:hypothetical protein
MGGPAFAGRLFLIFQRNAYPDRRKFGQPDEIWYCVVCHEYWYLDLL